MPWPEPVERVATFLRAAGAEARLEEIAEPTPTARDAARAVGASESEIVKSIVFRCGDRYVLALVPGDRRADPGKVAAAAGAPNARIASPTEVLEATGFVADGVAPFPVPRIARILVDQTLLAHELVWIGAGTEHHLAALPPAELVRLAEADAVRLTADSGE